MVIIETKIFTRIIKQLMSDDEYNLFQNELVKKPSLGKIIKGSGGLRKIRWKIKDSGKSGGVRVIYYWVVKDYQIRMLYAYPKSKQDNLTEEQLKILKQIMEGWSDE